jgi:hypothetical protein
MNNETTMDGFHESDYTDMEPVSQEAQLDDETNEALAKRKANEAAFDYEDDESAVQHLRQALLGANDDDDDDDTSSDDSSSGSAD